MDVAVLAPFEIGLVYDDEYSCSPLAISHKGIEVLGECSVENCYQLFAFSALIVVKRLEGERASRIE